MKTCAFVFTIISCAAVMHGISYADPPNPRSEQPQSGNRDKTISDRSSEGGRASNNQKRSDKTRTDSSRPNNVARKVTNLNQSGFNKSAAATRVGLLENKPMTNRILPFHPQGIVPLGGPPLKNLRNHGPSPAIIGGPATSTGNAAAINGTGLKR